MSKIGVIGDIHFREKLGYADFIKDNREEEKKEILSFIVENFKDCQHVVFLGDQFNSKNNSSNVVKEFVEFLERFDDKRVFIIAGNHEVGPERTAIDFLKEIKHKNWEIITRDIFEENNFTFCPYFSKSELDVEDNKKATKKLMQMLSETKTSKKNKILFVHHSISDSLSANGIPVSIFDEIVLPRKELEKEYAMIVAGHVHVPQVLGKTIIAGSIFNNEAGETQKYIWKIDDTTLDIEKIPLPGRKIFKFEDPIVEELEKVDKKNIVKIILTKKMTQVKLETLKEALNKFDAFVLLEQYPNERKKISIEGNKSILDLGIEDLLQIYSKENGVDFNKLMQGFKLLV